MLLICRLSVFEDKKYCEFLFEYNAELKLLCLPKTLPERYKSRIDIIKIFPENQTLYVVQSISTKTCEKICKNKLEICSGIWLTANDAKLQGSYITDSNELDGGKSQFMGCTIDHVASNVVVDFEKRCRSSNYFGNDLQYPLSLYHGTPHSNAEKILHENRLMPTFGMLGHAVYVGTFWKAARFSCYSQDHQKLEKGTIFRLLAFPSNISTFPRKDWMCDCEKCLAFEFGSQVSDHKSTWQKSFDCAHAMPTKSNDICRDGSFKHPLRNEEWAMRDDVKIFLTHYAEVDMSTVGESYNPYLRTIHIQ